MVALRARREPPLLFNYNEYISFFKFLQKRSLFQSRSEFIVAFYKVMFKVTKYMCQKTIAAISLFSYRLEQSPFTLGKSSSYISYLMNFLKSCNVCKLKKKSITGTKYLGFKLD